MSDILKPTNRLAEPSSNKHQACSAFAEQALTFDNLLAL